ncbi:transmembrane protein [Cyclospora cayetanensis]|nr:transmembrane protein [Cyclospora cayetanensis]
MSLRIRAALLFGIPLVYGSVLLALVVWLPLPFDTSPILSVSCVSYACLNLLTGCVGELGVLRRIEAALRATLVLLIMENVIMLFLSGFLCGFAVYRHMKPGKVDPYAHTWVSLWLPPAARVVLCVVLFLLSLISLCSLWVVAEYQAEVDAEAFLKDAQTLKQRERLALLHEYKEPLGATIEKSSGASEEEVQNTGEPQGPGRKPQKEGGSVTIAMPDHIDP